MKTETIKIKGLKCSGCENQLKSALLKIDGIISAFPSHITNDVKIEYDETKVSKDLIEKTIKSTGKEVLK